MQQQQDPVLKEKQEYAQRVINMVQSDPGQLNDSERRVATKYVAAVQQAQAIEKDVESLRGQLRQGEARLRSMELQLADSRGKTEAILDLLVSFKFEPMMPAPPAPMPSVELQEGAPSELGNPEAMKQKFKKPKLDKSAATPAA